MKLICSLSKLNDKWIFKNGQKRVRNITNFLLVLLTNLDTLIPSLVMLSTGTYQVSNGSKIYTTFYGVSGGTTICKNKTANDEVVTTIKDITGIGNYEIECTATSNSGKTVTKTTSYGLEGVFNASYYLNCTTFTSDNYCQISGTSLILPGPKNNSNSFSVAVQYGPYFKIQAGCYKITYNGSNLNNSAIIYQVYQSNPKINYTVLSLTTQSNIASYYINITDSLLNNNWNYLGKATGIEFILYNYSDVNIVIDSITVQSIGSCPKS